METKYTFIPKKQDKPICIEMRIIPAEERRIADSMCDICSKPGMYAVSAQMCPDCEFEKADIGFYKKEINNLMRMYNSQQSKFEISILINIILFATIVIIKWS